MVWKEEPTRMLLMFVEQLERQIYRSYEHSVTTLPLHLKNSALFFKTNSKVCDDWFARMRPTLLLSNHIFMSASSTIRQAMLVSVQCIVMTAKGACSECRM
jgi:PI-3-kinase-related kinase SMG-1